MKRGGMKRARWTWRGRWFGWTRWDDTADQVMGSGPDRRSVWRRIIFGLYRRAPPASYTQEPPRPFPPPPPLSKPSGGDSR
jgi:hypothetical protein